MADINEVKIKEVDNLVCGTSGCTRPAKRKVFFSIGFSANFCEEIKIVLHEEIAKHIISSRDIERYSPDKWKKKTKPQKNDNLSFLTKAKEHEKEERRTIAIDAQGCLVYEPKSILSKDQTTI